MQGWRLDPLLLFCQLLTAGTALGFAVEALRLRKEVRDIQVRPSPIAHMSKGFAKISPQRSSHSIYSYQSPWD